MSLDKAFELLMVNEANSISDGSYVNNPDDPVGETKYGASAPIPTPISPLCAILP